MNIANIVSRFNELTDISARREGKITETEEQIAQKLFQHMHQCVNRIQSNGTTSSNDHDYLLHVRSTANLASASTDAGDTFGARAELGREGEDSDSSVAAGDASCSKEDSDFQESPEFDVGGRKWTLQKMEEVVKFADDHPNYKFRTLQHRFRGYLKQPSTLSRIRTLLAEHKGGLRRTRKAINDAVLEQYKCAKQHCLPVHDADLQRWGRDAARRLGVIFKAGSKWLWSFKTNHAVTSRKITTIRTARELQNLDTIAKSASSFRTIVLQESLRFPHNLIFNSDQSGYTYEFHSTRTLADKGSKEVVVMVTSQNKCTHSYTIQPFIDYTGRLRGKLYICLKETNGRMGPVVERTYFRAPNVEVTCSSSGKLTSSLFRRWVELIFFPEAYDHCLLLLDSWTGQKDDSCFSIFPANHSCTRLQIPPKTTGTTQPLDVFYFRHWKTVVRRMFDFVRIHGIDINLGDRDNIIKMHSLIHHQFTSDEFVPIGHYAWYKSGLRRDKPAPFKGVIEILFPRDASECHRHNCARPFFIRCSFCNLNFCFSHFFVDYHTHFREE